MLKKILTLTLICSCTASLNVHGMSDEKLRKRKTEICKKIIDQWIEKASPKEKIQVVNSYNKKTKKQKIYVMKLINQNYCT